MDERASCCCVGLMQDEVAVANAGLGGIMLDPRGDMLDIVAIIPEVEGGDLELTVTAELMPKLLTW